MLRILCVCSLYSPAGPNYAPSFSTQVHPTCGPTQDDDIPGIVRYHTYEVSCRPDFITARLAQTPGGRVCRRAGCSCSVVNSAVCQESHRHGAQLHADVVYRC